MKTYILPSLKISFFLLVILAGLYPLLIAAAAKLAPGHGDGETVIYKGRVVGYANISQKFTRDEYFWSRPSAVDYNAAGSGGSNKGPTNAEYLKDVEKRIRDFLKRNPTVKREEIPAELVTASGSGLDPDLSPQGAKIQATRIAEARGISNQQVLRLVDQQAEEPLLGLFGPARVNVLKLNIALDQISK